MTVGRRSRAACLAVLLSLAGLAGARAQPFSPKDAPAQPPQAQPSQPQPSQPRAEAPRAGAGAPTMLDRFRALPAERQEALRNRIQPIFSHNLMANARLIRLQQDCSRPLPSAAAPAEQILRDLQDPNGDSAVLFGPSRQGALLAQFKGALGVPGNCSLADDQEKTYGADLAGFAPRFRQILEEELGRPG